MVSLPGHYVIESNTRLHHQGAAPPATAGVPAGAGCSNLALHVGGWSNDNTAFQMHNSTFVFPGPRALYGKASGRAGAKRALGDEAEGAPKRAREQRDETPPQRLRIDDLLNPAGGSAVLAAHRLTVPSALSRTRSADSKHYYQQLAQLQLQLQYQQQQQQQQQLKAPEPSRFARTATAPAGDASARGLVREALELDKLYDIACVIIESIWPNHSTSQRTQLCSLRCFVAETHRQSRLGVDALELCMFYLLRAKSIIQAKQRAERPAEARPESGAAMAPGARHASDGGTATTPPLSPDAAAPAMVVPVASGGATAVPSASCTSPLDASSPITPDTQPHGQVAYLGMGKQLVASGMITPLTPKKSRRVLAGSGHSLPNSFRTFVAAKPAAPAPAPTAAPAAGASGPTKPDATRCGRRMFVAALISASKFMYDQTYSNKAWNKITKLPPSQISDMERAFLDMIDYRLYVDRTTYDKFHRLLARSGMRNGRLMVCEALPAAPALSAEATPRPAPLSDPRAASADLRTAMNAPISISSTPIINPARATTGGN